MVGKRRHQADDAPGDPFCGLGQAVACFESRIGELVEAARQADDVTAANHSADRGRGDSICLELRQAHHPLRSQELDRLVALSAQFRH